MMADQSPPILQFTIRGPHGGIRAAVFLDPEEALSLANYILDCYDNQGKEHT